MAQSVEEMLKALLAGQQPGVALEDPEYGLDVSNLNSQLGEAEAEHVSQVADTQAKYERLRRAAERQLPKDVTQVQEQAAGRGMYYAGGRVEAEGRLNQGHADYVAQTAESQTSDMNNLIRGITSKRNDTQRGISLAQQNAAQRALERARNAAPPVVEEAVTTAPPVAQPVPVNVPRPVAVPAAPKPPVKTAAQIAQEKAWAAYVKFNPENARRVVLASRKK